MTSDKGKNKMIGLSELNILIIPGIKDRISNGKTKYEILPTRLCSMFFLVLINIGWAIKIRIQIEAITACICIYVVVSLNDGNWLK